MITRRAIVHLCIRHYRQEKELQRQREYEKQREREEKRKERELKKIREAEEHQVNLKIRNEERKLLIAQRKLESIRLLEALFERIKVGQYFQICFKHKV